MLGLKVNAPINRIFEVCLRLFKNFNRLGICYLCIICISEILQARK